MAPVRSFARMLASTGTAFSQPVQRQTLSTVTRQAFQRAFQTSSRRTQTAAKDVGLSAGVAGEASQAEGGSYLSKLWNSKVGPKTVHFWAPIFKWGVVLTGVSDFARPAESLSLTQNVALMCTGAIWTRWCFIIKPQNLFLASVNFLLFCVGATQVGRIVMYQQSISDEPLADGLKRAASEKAEALKDAAKDPKGALKAAKD